MTTDKELRGREATRDRLAQAAVAVIRRDGILAGLNLREVSDLAGVNRGNIYHYFGSRRELLRAALHAQFSKAIPWLSEGRHQPFVERKVRVFNAVAEDFRADTMLIALLAIDGDEAADPVPDLAHSIEDLHNDVANGHIDPDHDVEALQIAFSSLARGYAVFRAAYATRLDVSVEELDQRVSTVVRTWLGAMGQPPDDQQISAASEE